MRTYATSSVHFTPSPLPGGEGVIYRHPPVTSPYPNVGAIKSTAASLTEEQQILVRKMRYELSLSCFLFTSQTRYNTPRSTTQQHAVPRSTTQQHAATRSITQHHAALNTTQLITTSTSTLSLPVSHPPSLSPSLPLPPFLSLPLPLPLLLLTLMMDRLADPIKNNATYLSQYFGVSRNLILKVAPLSNEVRLQVGRRGERGERGEGRGEREERGERAEWKGERG